MTRVLIAALLITAAVGRVAAQGGQPAPATANRAITPLGGDLYLLRDGTQHTVFLATPAAIAVVDPLSLPTAQWLNEQLASRFPGVAVTHVLLTHSHPERAAGNGAFGRNVSIVAHDEFRRAIRESGRPSTEYRFVAFPTITFARRHTIQIGNDNVELVHAGPFPQAICR
jgi:glyoxylase-like metal-dependent hydrolase (beta-lactamase superfamily II)